MSDTSDPQRWPDGEPVVIAEDYTAQEIALAGSDPVVTQELTCDLCGEIITHYPSQIDIFRERPESDQMAIEFMAALVGNLEDLIKGSVRDHYARRHPDTDMPGTDEED